MSTKPERTAEERLAEARKEVHRERQRTVLERYQWSVPCLARRDEPLNGECPACGSHEEEGHADGCDIREVLES